MPANKLAYRDPLYNILKTILEKLDNHFGLKPCVGAELEFYLHNLKDNSQIIALEQVVIQLSENKVTRFQKERGYSQYEIDIAPSIEVNNYPEIIANLRNIITHEASKMSLQADFSSKPFKNDFGSSLHIHLNFVGDGTDVEKYAEILCHYLPLDLEIFLPKKEDYERLDSRFMAPTHISYGGNNRTTLIRIPDSLPRRIEHRLASANSNPYKVIIAILSRIYDGLKNPQAVAKLAKTYGNAYDEQYNLVEIQSLLWEKYLSKLV